MFVLRFQSFNSAAGEQNQPKQGQQQDEERKSGFESCVYHHVYIEENEDGIGKSDSFHFS